MRDPAAAEIEDAACAGEVVKVVGAQAGDGGVVDVRDESGLGIEVPIRAVVHAGEGGKGVRVGCARGRRIKGLDGVVWRRGGWGCGGHCGGKYGGEGEGEEDTVGGWASG